MSKVASTDVRLEHKPEMKAITVDAKAFGVSTDDYNRFGATLLRKNEITNVFVDRHGIMTVHYVVNRQPGSTAYKSTIQKLMDFIGQAAQHRALVTV